MPTSLLDAYAEILATPQARALSNANQYRKLSDMFEATYGASTLLRNEAGNITNVVTSNGFNFTFDSAAGAAEQYIAGNALVTDATFDAASNTLTANFGNIVDGATGEVKKKGLMAGATTGAKVLGGAFAAFGAVMTGVNWYKDNPEFWTDVSKKLLPFAYSDPTNKSWGEIFQEALVPTAVDSDGNTYVQADMLEQLASVLVANGVFQIGTAYNAASTYPDSLPEEYKNYTVQSVMRRNQQIIAGSSTYVSTSKDVNVVAIKDASQYMVIFGDTDNFLYGSNNRTYVEPNTSPTRDSIDGKQIYHTNFSSSLYYGITLDPPTPINIVNNISRAGLAVTYIVLYGIAKDAFIPDNTQLLPDATYPTGGNLSDVYPDWYKNAVTTINPDWNPSEPESDDNQKYVTWLPLQFPDKNVPDGDTEPDATPGDAQSGKPKPNTPVDPDTQTALNDGVLPNPYPNPDEEPSINPTPQPQPQPQPTPEPTDPSDPGSIPAPEPTPGIPSIGGGSASALWKIYNPSQSILQSFGKWLWSADPVKMIKELFSNNPAEGIVGLHMIYVTPPTGGTANIVVGYVDSGVASPWVSQQYVPLDCGSVTIPLRYQSALDFGYTKVYCYLPFIGIVPLDSFDVIGKTVHIRYTVDVLTGTILAQISVSDGNYSAVLYTFNGSCSVEYPLTSGSRASQVLSLVTGAVGGAVVGGVGGAILGGARGALTGGDVRMSGNISGNAGAMGIRKPYIIVKRPVEVAARNYNNFYGYPANKTGKLSTFSGYTRVKDVHVDEISGASADEKTEIENLLKSGVIIN